MKNCRKTLRNQIAEWGFPVFGNLDQVASPFSQMIKWEDEIGNEFYVGKKTGLLMTIVTADGGVM